MHVLTLVGHAPFYYYAYIIIPNDDIKKRALELLSQHIVYVENPQRNFTEKVIEWFSNLIPDEEENPENVSSLLQKLRKASL